MGMAGGAYKGDMDRAKLRLQAAQIANSRRAQLAHEQHQKDALAEQARQADMADARANRALDIQEQRNQPAQEAPERRSPYSVFSNADILAAARQRASDRRLAELEGQNSVLGQFEQVVGMEKRQQAAKKAHGQATMAALMKVAMANGGQAPMAALNFANRQFGFDGKTRAIGGAGFTADGTWFVDFLSKDQNGQLARQTSTMPLEQQGQVYYGQAGIFDNADRAAWRKRMLDSKYSTQEVNTLSGLNATAIEGLDEAGLQRLEQGFVDPSRSDSGDWKKELAFRKQELMEAKFAQSLGQKSLDAAQKYALYHFKDFGAPRKATQEDVDNGLAKNVGDPFMPTPKMQFDEAVQFYRDNMGGEDPATSADGRDPAKVSAPADTQPPANGNPQDGNANPADVNANPQDGNANPPNGNEPPSAPGAPEQPEQPEQPNGRYHVIGEGDDLVSVAIKYNVSPSQLKDLNKGVEFGENGEIATGTKLNLPIQAGTVEPPPAPGIEDGGETPAPAQGGMAGGEQQGELDFGGGGGAAPAEGGEEGGGAPVDAPVDGGGGGGEEGGAPPPPPQEPPPEEEGGGGMAADANGGATQQSGGGMASGANGGKTEAQLEEERKRKKWSSRIRKR